MHRRKMKLTGNWKILHNAEHRGPCGSPCIVRKVKSSTLRWVGLVDPELTQFLLGKLSEIYHS
jgi:hypothetical protein